MISLYRGSAAPVAVALARDSNPTLRAMIAYVLKQEPLEENSHPSGNT
jgi:hypothetical protein